MEKMTVDEGIARLRRLHKEVGGTGLLMVIDGTGTSLRAIEFLGTAKVAKSDPRRIVSRGGMPVVVAKLV